MSRVKVYCLVEGFAEANLVDRILAPHLGKQGIDIFSPMVTTRRDRRSGVVHKGGGRTFRHWQKDLMKLGRQWDHDDNAWLTTMLDIYGLPNDFPQKDAGYAIRSSKKKAEFFEKTLAQEATDLGVRRFIPYFSLHEFETLLLSDVKALATLFLGKEREIRRLESEIATFADIEDINHTQAGAPSNRIAKYIDVYDKYKGSDQSGSVNVLELIGLDNLRNRCRHFSMWIEKIEALTKQKSNKLSLD